MGKHSDMAREFAEMERLCRRITASVQWGSAAIAAAALIGAAAAAGAQSGEQAEKPQTPAQAISAPSP